MGVSGKEAKETEVKGSTYWLMALPGTKGWKRDKSKTHTSQDRSLKDPRHGIVGGPGTGVWGGGGVCFGTSRTLFLTSLWPLNSR